MRHLLGIGGREDEFKGANTLKEAAVDPVVIEQQKAALAAQGTSAIESLYHYYSAHSK